MNKLALTTAAALLLATPVLAQTPGGDGEVRNAIEWQNIVAKANADRTGNKVEDVAATKATSATDAAQQAPAAKPATTHPRTWDEDWRS